MKSPRLTALLAGLVLLLITSSSVFAAGGPYTAWSQGFDTDTAGWLDNDDSPGFGTITQVPSGTDGITSASGTGHAVVASSGDSGPFTRFGGYRSV